MNKKPITILSIETTCDDTAISIIQYENDNFNIISNLISSQIKEHNQFGGVVPELASRMHIKNIIPILDKSSNDLKKYFEIENKNNFEILKEKIDYISITNKGGGLIGSQVVGVETAKTLSLFLDKPIVSINHIRAHILASFFNFYDSVEHNSGSVKKLVFPIIALTVSGGHTQLILIKNYKKWELIGSTTDDAAGECFDKISKLLNLGYPGGPIISKLAEAGNPDSIKFPRPMINSKDYNFSFSGLKTAVLYYVQKIKNIDDKIIADICASSQEAIVDVLAKKSIKAVEEYKPKYFILAGGVAANKKLRERLKNDLEKTNTKFLMPEIPLCMDNALMVNIATYFNILNKVDIKKYKDIKSNIDRKI